MTDKQPLKPDKVSKQMKEYIANYVIQCVFSRELDDLRKDHYAKFLMSSDLRGTVGWIIANILKRGEYI